MLFEFHSCELSHVDPGGRVLNVVGTANNVSPQRDHFLALDELCKNIRYHHCHWTCRAYTVESKRVLSSRLQPGLQPGRRLRGYRCIPAQHPLDDAWTEHRQGITVRQGKRMRTEMDRDGVHDAALSLGASGRKDMN